MNREFFISALFLIMSVIHSQAFAAWQTISRILFLLPFLVFLIMGCETHKLPKDTVPPKYMTPEQRIVALEQKVELLEGYMEYLRTFNRQANFSPGSRGYQKIETNVGFLLAFIDDIKPYANGYEVTFKIGNPHSMKYRGFTLTVKWGKNADKEKTDSYSETLLPGTWNTVKVRLTPATQDDVNSIFVNIDVNSVGMYER